MKKAVQKILRKDEEKQSTLQKENIMKQLCILITLIVLNGCVSTGQKTITPVDSAQFRLLAAAIPAQLQHLGFTDENNYWYEPVVALPNLNVGDTLYHHLDPSFHYENSLMNPSSFAELSPTNVTITNTSFSYTQGADRVSCELIAKMDWNNDGSEDWIILFSLTTPASQAAAKYYYLLVTNTNRYPLQTQLIASRSGTAGSIVTHMRMGVSQEYEVGETSLIEAPTHQAAESNVASQSLSE